MWREERREGPAISGSAGVGWGMPQDATGWVGASKNFKQLKDSYAGRRWARFVVGRCGMPCSPPWETHATRGHLYLVSGHWKWESGGTVTTRVYSWGACSMECSRISDQPQDLSGAACTGWPVLPLAVTGLSHRLCQIAVPFCLPNRWLWQSSDNYTWHCFVNCPGLCSYKWSHDHWKSKGVTTPLFIFLRLFSLQLDSKLITKSTIKIS